VQAQSGEGGEACCFVEKVEIVQSKLLLDGFFNLYYCRVLLSAISVGAGKLDEAFACLSFNLKLNPVWISFDCNALGEGLKLLADL
jgi:hypothetical protein